MRNPVFQFACVSPEDIKDSYSPAKVLSSFLIISVSYFDFLYISFCIRSYSLTENFKCTNAKFTIF